MSGNLFLKFGVNGLFMIAILMMGNGFFSLAYSQNLQNRPGQTTLQSNTGLGVNRACMDLNAAAGGPTMNFPMGTPIQQLTTLCRSLVQTGIANDGGPVGMLNRMISNDELNAGLQQAAVEEVLAPRTQATKTFNGQLQNLGSRLSAIRLGARGISVAGLNFDGLNPQAGLSPEVRGSLGFPQRGGGASGDSGGGEFSRLSAFINGVLSTGDKDASSRENGFDFETQGVTAGVDYRFLDELVIGTAFTYTHFDADFSRSSVSSGGDSDTDGYVGSLYGTYYLENFYLEGIGSIGWNDHDMKRKINIPSNNPLAPPINETAKGDTDSTQYSFTVGTGYTANVGNIDFGPYARLTYFKIDVDGFKESGAGGLNLDIDDQDIDSLISALGARVSKKFSWERGVWFPQIRFEWNHEYKNDAETTNTSYINDPGNNRLQIRNENPDRDFFRLGGTLANVSAGGTQVFVDYETMLGFRDISNHIFSFGLRQEF